MKQFIMAQSHSVTVSIALRIIIRSMDQFADPDPISLDIAETLNNVPRSNDHDPPRIRRPRRPRQPTRLRKDAAPRITIISEPWMGAKVNMDGRASSARKGNAHHQEPMMFGADSAIGQQLNYQVLLSAVLLMVIAAFTAH